LGYEPGPTSCRIRAATLCPCGIGNTICRISKPIQRANPSGNLCSADATSERVTRLNISAGLAASLNGEHHPAGQDGSIYRREPLGGLCRHRARGTIRRNRLLESARRWLVGNSIISKPSRDDGAVWRSARKILVEAGRPPVPCKRCAKEWGDVGDVPCDRPR